jgi:hypothetical protein
MTTKDDKDDNDNDDDNDDNTAMMTMITDRGNKNDYNTVFFSVSLFQINIRFHEALVETFEYPSEETMLEEYMKVMQTHRHRQAGR